MKLEVFKQIVFLLKKDSERSDKLYKLGIDTINFNDELHQAITLLLRTYYSRDGEDMISWWMWENVEKFVYDSAGNKTDDLTKIEDLWEYVEKIRKSTDFEEYIPEKKRKKSKKQLQKMFKQMLEK